MGCQKIAILPCLELRRCIKCKLDKNVYLDYSDNNKTTCKKCVANRAKERKRQLYGLPCHLNFRDTMNSFYIPHARRKVS